jgi:hypothetical protein
VRNATTWFQLGVIRDAGPHNHPNKTPDEVVEKILHLRRTYHMGPIRIVWYLYRYEKQVPGHHVQVDVKFLTLKQKKGASVRRYQYTAIDDATRRSGLSVSV